MLARLNPALLPAIEAEWRAHLDDGLVVLRRTPSGGVRKFCDAIRAEPDLLGLERLVRMASGHATQVERDEIADLLLRQHGADTIPVHALRGGIAFQLAAGADAATARRLKATLDELGDAETPKAPALRQALFPLLAARYGAKPAKMLGAEYRMPLGQADGAALSLWLDFGGMARGIRWAVELGLPGARGMAPSASYEGLLGIMVNGWDILRTDLVEPDLALLVARVDRTVAMLGGVRWA